MTRAAWILGAAVLYLAAAWSVAPGFYDGFGPPAPYCFTTTPPNVKNCGDHPRGGSQTIHVTNGVSDPTSAFTADGQAELSVKPGAFSADGKSSVTIKLDPVTQFPAPTGLRFLTNVYLITADAPLKSDGLVTLRYSADLPAPSFIYEASQGSTTWNSIGSTNTAAPYFISANAPALGYFAAGYSANATPPAKSPTVGGGQSVPLLIALGIVIVIVATLPLAFMRRRGAED